MVQVKEKERARLKEESVGRGREIAVMRETVTKMKRELEVDKNRKVPRQISWCTQTVLVC